MAKIQNYLKQVSLYVFIGLLAYMPLHILVSTWFGASFHVLEQAKVLKDVVFIIGFIFAIAASILHYINSPKTGKWLPNLFKQKIVWLIAAYIFLTLIMAIIKPTDTDAEILGFVYNVRFLFMFVYAMLLAGLFDLEYLRKYAVKIVVVVGVIVALFGVIQYLLLPDTALAHLGYSRSNGVLPAFFIDNKPDFERVMSTLRDPNSLGSYLIIIGSLLGAYGLKSKNRDFRIMVGGASALVGLCLLFTFSRSAWIGAVAAGLVFGVFYMLNNPKASKLTKKYKKWLIVLACALLLVMSGVVMARNTYFVQNVILHADKSTILEDPNELRLRFWSESIKSAIENPMGHGPGTAGLASIRNNAQGTVLTENYYLQVLYEVGFVGLILFLAILAAIAFKLYQTYRSEDNLFALAVLSSLAGLMITNFLVHIWSNEAVAYTFWALAGLYIIKMPTKTKN